MRLAKFSYAAIAVYYMSKWEKHEVNINALFI